MLLLLFSLFMCPKAFLRHSLPQYTIVALVKRITDRDRDSLYLFAIVVCIVIVFAAIFLLLAHSTRASHKRPPRSGAAWQSRLSVIPPPTLHCIQISLSLLMPTRFHNVSSLFCAPYPPLLVCLRLHRFPCFPSCSFYGSCSCLLYLNHPTV